MSAEDKINGSFPKKSLAFTNAPPVPYGKGSSITIMPGTLSDDKADLI